MSKQQQGQEFDDRTIDEESYVLRLFVTGATPNSSRAISNLKEICETYLKGKYELEIIDVYQQPLIAENEANYRFTNAYKKITITANEVDRGYV